MSSFSSTFVVCLPIHTIGLSSFSLTPPQLPTLSMLPPPLFLFAVGTCAVSNKLERQEISQRYTHPTADCIFCRILLYEHLLGMIRHTHAYIHTYTRLLKKVCTPIFNPLFYLPLKASQKTKVRLSASSEFCAAMTVVEQLLLVAGAC